MPLAARIDPRATVARRADVGVVPAVVDPFRHVAVEVNGDLVPRERHPDFQLSNEDRVEVVTLVGGG